MAESQMVCERKNSPGNGIGRDQSGNRIGMACTESSRSPAETGNKKAGLETNWHNLRTGQTGPGNSGLGLSHVTPPPPGKEGLSAQGICTGIGDGGGGGGDGGGVPGSRKSTRSPLPIAPTAVLGRLNAAERLAPDSVSVYDAYLRIPVLYLRFLLYWHVSWSCVIVLVPIC